MLKILYQNNINQSMSLKVIEIDPNYDPSQIDANSFQQGGGGNPDIDIQQTGGSNMEFPSINFDLDPSEQTGGDFNPENMELDLPEFDFEESGNPIDPDQDSPAPDNKEFDSVEKGIKDEELDAYSQTRAERSEENYLREDEESPKQDNAEQGTNTLTNFTSHWRHPELGLDQAELAGHLDKEQIQNQVNYYLANYYSAEYQEYLEKLNWVYAKVGKKYYLRRTKEGVIYLMMKTNEEIKNKQFVQEKTTKDYEDEYIVKIDPPHYVSIKETLELIDEKLRHSSVKIRNLQNELLEKGGDVTERDIERFKRKKRQFFELVNRKQIYINYYYEVNNVSAPEDKVIWNGKKMVERENSTGEKVFYFESVLIDLSVNTIEEFKENFKQQFALYTDIVDVFQSLDHSTKNKNSKYDEMMKEYLKNYEKINQFRFEKIRDGIFQKEDKIDFLVDKLPVVTVRKNIFT